MSWCNQNDSCTIILYDCMWPNQEPPRGTWKDLLLSLLVCVERHHWPESHAIGSSFLSGDDHINIVHNPVVVGQSSTELHSVHKFNITLIYRVLLSPPDIPNGDHNDGHYNSSDTNDGRDHHQRNRQFTVGSSIARVTNWTGACSTLTWKKKKAVTL